MKILLTSLISAADILATKIQLTSMASEICAGEQTQEACKTALAFMQNVRADLRQLMDDEGNLEWTIPGEGKSPTCEPV